VTPTQVAALVDAVDGVLCSWQHHHRTIAYLLKQGWIEVSHTTTRGIVYRATQAGRARVDQGPDDDAQ
jgi:hypothetical protein